MSTRIRTYAVSLFSSWAGYGANLLVMFFLSPFVVHSLGESRYGVWSLLMTVTGYLGLAELGVRVSTGRYINYYLGRGQLEQVPRVVNTSLLFYLLLGVPIMMVSAVLGHFFGTVFPRIDPQLASQANVILLLAGLNVWMGLIASTFTQLLVARDRFDLTNATQIVSLVIRAGGTVLALQWGMGLIELSIVLLLSSAAAMVMTIVLWRWRGQPSQLALRLASWRSFREIFSFGAWSFLGNFSARIIDYTNAVIIGILLGEREITYYAIGFMLINYGRDALAYITRVITPDIQKAAGGSLRDLRSLMVQATNATMLLAVPMLCGLIVLGPQFICQWMGPQYGRSGTILIIVTIAQFGWLANTPSGTILNAMGKVKLMAAIYASEAAMNLVLSVALVQLLGLGIVGVALGTLVPSLIITSGVMLVVGCRHTGMGIGEFLHATLRRWGLAAAAFTPVCIGVAGLIPQQGWLPLAAKALISLALYIPIGLWLILGRDRSLEILRRAGLARVIGRPAARPTGEAAASTRNCRSEKVLTPAETEVL